MGDSEIRVLRGVEVVIERPAAFTLNQTIEEVIAWCEGYRSGAGHDPHCSYAIEQINSYLAWLHGVAEGKGFQSHGVSFGVALRQVFLTDKSFFAASRRFLDDYRASVGNPE